MRLSLHYPPFYACYLLNSTKLPLDRTATYIGSTPDPPRRIRQHNGELQAGARRTVSNRPWAMHMIVHGFPSKLAALQFEWAWQHPHKSRHFQHENGRIFGNRATKRVDRLIQIVRTMITTHPFNTWPLHVKLFTQQAVDIWKAASTTAMPPGFTCSIELEGVDGKLAHPGSGRKGPIANDDAEFTNTHLAKHTSLLATQTQLECNICLKPMHNYPTEPLESSLCPSSHCTAVSHLSCLSQHFLTAEKSTNTQIQNKSELIPRGGICKTCNTYILWGDVIRASYRRFRALQKTQDGADPTVLEDDLFVSDEDGSDPTSPKKKTTKRVSSRSSSGESFDFDNISSSSGSESPPLRRRGRPPSPLLSPKSKKRATKTKTVRPRKTATSSESEGNIPKRKPGRPRSKTVLPIASPTSSSKTTRPPKKNSPSISTGSVSDKRKPGRPRKENSPSISPSSASAKRKPGRPRKEKDDPLSQSTIPIKQKKTGRRTSGLATSPSTFSRSATLSSSKRGIHSLHRDSSSGESFDFAGLSDEEASDEDFELYLARIAERLKNQKVFSSI